ncbi:MAG: site-specific integrase [Cellulosilyticum sp.]|nr:site-specific integrase [Cellulosilyticum sp.]
MSKRRPKGTGSVRKEKLANGKVKWKGYVVCGYSTEGNPKRKCFSGDTQKEVQEKMAAFQVEQMNSVKVTSKKQSIKSNISLQDYVAYCLFKKQFNKLKETTLARYNCTLENQIEGSNLGKMPINTITNEDLEDYYDSLMEEYEMRESKRKKNPESYIKNVHKLINKSLKVAVKEGLIHENPASEIDLPKTMFEVEEERLMYFKEEEQKEFLKSAVGNRYYALFLMAFRTGLRQGELIGLRWSDINFDEKYVYVRRTTKTISVLDEERNKHYMTIETEPKTKSSKRKVPLTPELIEELKRHKKQLLKEQDKNYEVYFHFEDFVFPTEWGTMVDARNLTRTYQRILNRADISYRNFHSIRHTFATRLFEKGVAPKKVQKLMGHKDIATTMNIYTHINEEALYDDVALLDS